MIVGRGLGGKSNKNKLSLRHHPAFATIIADGSAPERQATTIIFDTGTRLAATIVKRNIDETPATAMIVDTRHSELQATRVIVDARQKSATMTVDGRLGETSTKARSY